MVFGKPYPRAVQNSRSCATFSVIRVFSWPNTSKMPCLHAADVCSRQPLKIIRQRSTSGNWVFKAGTKSFRTFSLIMVPVACKRSTRSKSHLWECSSSSIMCVHNSSATKRPLGARSWRALATVYRVIIITLAPKTCCWLTIQVVYTYNFWLIRAMMKRFGKDNHVKGCLLDLVSIAHKRVF